MRFVSTLLVFVVLAILVGCGKDGPVVPTAMTSEQEQKFQDDEKKAANEEQAHNAERRSSNNGPRTAEQQAEQDERMHRGRR